MGHRGKGTGEKTCMHKLAGDVAGRGYVREGTRFVSRSSIQTET